MSSDESPPTVPEPPSPPPDAPLGEAPGPAAPPEPVATTAVPAGAAPPTKSLTVLSWVVIAAGIILIVAGAVTWFVVRDQLSDEQITVSEDADYFAGDEVDGPLTAYSQADTINHHALEASGGKTYAELDQDDPVRETVMTASFLRASLFTSVVSFGVAAFAAAVGVLMIIIGLALLRIRRLLAALSAGAAAVT
jgi:hypothetical protein